MNDKPRNVFRFRLKSILVLMAVISIVVSLIVDEFHNESRKKQMASEVVRRGGRVQFVHPSQQEHKATNVVNGWLTLLLGDKFFADVSAVALEPGSADIHDFVCLFPEVRSLRVSGSDVTAESLQLISGLSQLEGLGLFDATALNEQWLFSLTKLENLRSMGFENCTLSKESMRFFSKKPTLLRLTFVNCTLSNENLRALAEIDSLRILTFRNCPINDSNLQFLYGSRAPVNLNLELEPNSVNVTEAGMLAIREANPSWSISFRDQFANEETVNYATKNYLPSIEDMPQLRSLSFQGPLTTDATMAALKDANNLNSLFLGSLGSGTRITSVGLASLHGLKNLRELYLQATKITITEAAEIAKLGSLELLNVEDSSIEDGVFDELAKMNALKALQIVRTTIIKGGLSKLTNLRELYFNGTELSSNELSEIAKLNKLESLIVWESPLNDDAIDELAKMTLLKSIALGKTAISKDGIARLRQALPNCLIEAN